MDNKWTKRLVSLTVALEMFCSPVAMARAEGDASERPEIPAVVFEERSETPAVSGGGGSADLMALPVDERDLAVDLSFGIPLEQGVGGATYPARYKGYFTHEGGSARDWGYRTFNTGEKYFVKSGDNFYTVLPDPGRLPDLELDGFYVLGEPIESWLDEDTRVSKVQSWTYDETWGDGALKVEWSNDDVGFTANDDVDYFEGKYLSLGYIESGKMEELFNSSIARHDDVMGFVPMVARWKDSANANLTSLSATTYTQDTGAANEVAQLFTEDPTGKADPARVELSAINAAYFDDDAHTKEFWLRVSEDQESLTLKFAAYEPYYAYNVTQNGAGDSPVSVSVLFNDRNVTTAEGEAIQVRRGWSWDDAGQPTDAIVPQPRDTSGWLTPTNRDTNPARSHWSVENIPLAKVAQAEDMDNARTTITITVEAPNGDRERYILHVERLMTPTYTLGLGNTPLAMIEKDQRGNWGETESRRRQKKDEAKELFAQSFRLGYGGAVSPGDYTYYKSDFTTAAWTGFSWQGQKNYNIDLDETAVVAYQDTAFADPGVTFVGSNGKAVEFGANAPVEYQDCVTRTIELRKADKLTADGYGASGEACWYTAEGGQAVLKSTQTAQVLQNADGSDGVDLRGLRILPGIYTMTYTFTDPLDPGNPVVAQRPLVVLPIPGDVDMDGAVTVADAMALRARQADWETSNALDVQLLRFRVLGTKTAQDIIQGYQPVLADLGRSDYFYPPLPAPDDASDTYQRRTWDQVEMNGSARLELRFLGVEQGILDGENSHTNPATDGVVDLEHGKIGPWQADGEGEVTVREKDVLTGKDKYGISGQNDVFWVGVYLTPGDLAGSTVEDLTLTLTYDSDFVAPMVVYKNGQFPDASQDNYWYRALYYYNFGDGSKLDQSHTMTLFSGYNRTDYDYETGSAMSRAYATHYSKVIGELEQLQSNSSLREMVVSIQGSDAPTSHRATLPGDEVCVLAVPFRLLKHPTGGRLTGGKARLVELGAGMRDFTLVTKAASGASRGVSASSVFGRLFSAYAEGDGRAMESGDVTYAFSAQDDIYGGSTRNLREKVSYKDDANAIPGMIPIGENKTSATVLRKAKYAEDYGTLRIDGGGQLTAGSLPAGMEYHHQSSGQGVITGAPTEVGDGEFAFTITRGGVETYYVLPVEKRTLHFYPNGCGSYYGQDRYRGQSNESFTFTYRVSELADRDVPEDVELEGDGAELVSILGSDGSYTPPTFTAKLSRNTTDAENPVQQDTKVGTYPVILDDGTALDDKYDLVLDETTQNKQVLEILRRPVWIDHIEASPEQTGAQIYSDGSRLDCLVTIDEKESKALMIHLALRDEVIANGSWGGRPLTGEARVGDDALKLTFSGEFLRNADDEREFPDNKDMFYMTGEEVERSIGKITISEANRTLFNKENPNYDLQLVSGAVLHGEDNDVRGKVMRREITELEFSDYPNALNGKGSVTYGEYISLADLRIRVFRDDQQIGSQPYDFTYDYDGSMAQAMDIHYNWVTKEEMEAGLKSPNTLIGSGWDPTQPKGRQDARPYRDTNETLSVDMDGMYLCAIARKYALNDPDAVQDANAYVKEYSAYPIHVLPKEVTLSVTDMNRFYGEETAQPSYTYAVNQLSSGDLQKLRAHYGQDYVFTGASEELEWLMEGDKNFQKPTIQFMRSPRLPESDTDEDLVTTETNATNTYYYQVISGARSTNYRFRYARVDGDRRPSADFGTAYLSIMKRPIVVADVGSRYTTDASGHVVRATTTGKDTFAVLYADSKRLLLDDQVDDGVHTPFTASAAVGAVDRVTFTAPAYDPDTQTVTYYNGGASDNVTQQTGMAYSVDHPVLEKDLADLKITYKVQFLPDQGQYSWNSFSDNYYSVEDLTAAGGQAQRPVELRELALTSDTGVANNYMLVYTDSFQAVRRAPANSTLVNAPDPSNTTNPGNAAFQQYGTGLVILRPIKTMDIKSVGCMQYTYGEYFAPDNPGVSGSQLTLSVNYDTRYDNYTAPYVGNVNSETVAYTYETDTSSFAKRGFVIHYIDPATQTEQGVGESGQILMGGDPLYPATHNGKHLFVSGKRGENDPLVYSSITAAALEIAQTPLVLTARNIHRFYGEDNQTGYVVPLNGESPEQAGDGSLTFTYAFQASQLARWDRETLSELLGKTIREVDTVTQGELEQALDLAAKGSDEQKAWAKGFGYQKPAITTAANQTSPINTSDGKWGEYPITNTAKSFANYKVEGVGATLYVYPRPIRVTGIASSQDDPVYTIYNQTAGKIFNTAFDQDRITVKRSNDGLSDTWAQDLADGIHRGVDLPLTGSALVGTDALKYRASIDYSSNDTTLPEGKNEAYMDVVATITGFAASADQTERNYNLSTSRNGAYTDDQATGAVKLRTIGYIIIRQLPESKYDYGQTLSLDGLRVTVNYKMLGDEGGEYDSVNVDYIDANQFQSYGLYVNYWDPDYDAVPDQSRWKSIPNGYRKAGTGDHLTIAPTHDTQQFLGNDKSKPLERPFAANGMGLIISAFQEGENQNPAQPKVLAATRELIPGAGVESYEVTDTNKTPFTITVRPRRLQYTLSATDKTYNGDGKTAGTLRLTNLFDQKNVQTKITSTSTAALHTPVYQDVTDVVYVPVGASYESLGDNYQSYTGTGYQVAGSAISFTTGAYTDGRASLLDQNPAVQWASGYQWGKGLLEFTFPNANVHYVDDTFLSGAVPGVGTAELAQYWRASQDLNGVDGRWDSYPDVSQMPVEVNNMTFMGPDAANYTWGPSTEAQVTETQVTLDTDRATLGSGQADLPYATVHKANRQSIQDLLSGKDFVLPTLQVDEHTNVIRVTYGEDLDKIDDRTGVTEQENVLTPDGADEFRDELHFEYALVYESDGLLRQWAGRAGDQGYQDTLFFGGETVAPEVDPGYVPQLDRLDKLENASERTVYKGQRYRWAQEDTGLSERGWREDGGFTVDPMAYPGYATYGEAVRDAYWYYDLYTTDRTALPRDTVFYPLVRLAETHNYHPSGDLTADGDGDGRPDVSAWELYEARQAVSAYVTNADETQAEALLAQAQAKSGATLEGCRDMEALARKQAQDRVAADAARVEEGFPDEPPQPDGPIAAVKSYRQRFDLLSANWERQDQSEYLVTLLEDARFTDTLAYNDQKLMDSVVYNNPTRYYGYYWDPDRSGAIKFNDEEKPIDFDTVMQAEIRQRQSNGETVDTIFTYDPVASGHTAQLYVDISGGRGGRTVRSIRIVPSALFVRLGDAPVQLSVVTDPKKPINRRYTWTTSDPSVVTVDGNGLVTIRGEGTAVITVTTTNRRSDSITVVVSPVLPFTPGQNPIFNFYYTGAWAELDEDNAFRPHETMTRGEVARLLDLFLNPEHEPSETREIAYVDVTGREKYYGALCRLTKVGAVVGVPGTAFAGERLATRAEFVTILARMLELNVPDTVGMAHAFADSGEDATWAYAYIDAMAKAGVIRGTGGGSFAPDRPITREEAAAIMARLVVSRMDAADQTKLRVPSDMTPENWSYPAVLRAVNSVVAPGF